MFLLNTILVKEENKFFSRVRLTLNDITKDISKDYGISKFGYRSNIFTNIFMKQNIL